MSASFGKLQGQTLELKDGLNIIHAPNETGKSTWCAFLLATLYGINSRERDKAGFIAEKNRYAPWSGAAMSGRLDCRALDAELTLTRSTRRQTAPMGEFQAVYTGTGNPVADLTGQNCGETLLGVSREVYERSAFIRQSGLAITQDAGLERRIAALITSGEEDVSYSEAADALKKQLNRRRHNKTGQLPALEAELQETTRQLEEIARLEQELTVAREKAEAFSAREEVLKQELALHDLRTLWQKQQELVRTQEAAQEAEASAALLRRRLEEERIPENETIGRLRGALVNLETTRKALEKARSDRDEAAKALLRAEAAVGESPFVGMTPEEARRAAAEPPQVKVSGLVPVLAGLATVAVVAAIIYFLILPTPLAIACSIPFGVAVSAALGRRTRAGARTAALTKRFGTADPEQITALAETYIARCAVRAAAQAEADKFSATAEGLYATLSANEQAFLLEIRRFAPAAFDISAADQLLRECAQRRKALTDAETAAAAARLRADMLAEQAPQTQSVEQEPPVPARSRDAVSAELTALQAEELSLRSAADTLSGRLLAIGDRVVLESSAQRLAEEITVLEAEYSAIRLAMDTLETANTTLQNRFSPTLGKRAAEIFAQLTENRYSGVVLDRAFHLSAEPAGDALYRDAQLLSAGAADQLYLAARLAICELVLPQEQGIPIVLDDALANFDDERCAVALQWLKREAANRQILLFSCHSREAEFFAGDSEVSVLRLTDAV